MGQKEQHHSHAVPSGNFEKYERGHLYYLCQCLFAGFGGIVAQGTKSKVRNFEIHTGNWGCGVVFNNNKELIYLSQMIVASIMGIRKICFHEADSEAFLQARQKFENLVDEFNFEELVSYLEAQEYVKGA